MPERQPKAWRRYLKVFWRANNKVGYSKRKDRMKRTVHAVLTMVEPRGIEPLSENQSIQASPSAAGLFKFPCRAAVRQAAQLGSPEYNPALRGARADRSPLIDALSAAVVLRGRTTA